MTSSLSEKHRTSLADRRIGCAGHARRVLANHTGLVSEEVALTRGTRRDRSSGARVGVHRAVAVRIGRRERERVAALRASSQHAVNAVRCRSAGRTTTRGRPQARQTRRETAVGGRIGDRAGVDGLLATHCGRLVRRHPGTE